VLLVAGERLLDIDLLELGDCLVEEDVAFQHFVNQRLESGVYQSSFPVNNL
jgi:hypothetical protein